MKMWKIVHLLAGFSITVAPCHNCKLCSWNNCTYSVFTLAVLRYPTIKSGDTIALRSAYTSGSYSKYWLKCYTSYCYWSTCSLGGSIMTSSGWTSCTSRMIFTITAKGKTNGEPINSGDTVSLSSNYYSSSYRLYCTASSDTPCKMQS